jgi:hypothetical protein
MNFDKYKNQLPYPTDKYVAELPEFKFLEEEIDTTPLTKVEREKRLYELKEKKIARFKELRTQYNEEQQRLIGLFEKDMEKEHRFHTMPDKVKAAIHRRAWVLGHNAVLSEVSIYYYDLVDFAKLVISETKK